MMDTVLMTYKAPNSLFEYTGEITEGPDTSNRIRAIFNID